jgi:hypothetical protein
MTDNDCPHCGRWIPTDMLAWPCDPNKCIQRVPCRNLAEEMESARASVRRMKKHTPYIFNEWQRLQNAKKKLREARVELAAAITAWKNLGAKP